MKWLTAIGLVVLTFIGILLGRRDNPMKAERMLRERQEERRRNAMQLNESRKAGVKAEANARRARAAADVGPDKQAELLKRIRRYRGADSSPGGQSDPSD